MFPQNSIQMSRSAFLRPIHFLINYPTDAFHLQLLLGGFGSLVCPNYATIETHPPLKTHIGIFIRVYFFLSLGANQACAICCGRPVLGRRINLKANSS